MFDSFIHHDVMTDRGTIHAVVGGDGPPLLLLHGFPETHLMWHAVAPALAERFTVIAVDLPGYGDSHSPEPGEDHAPHSKRAMAHDLVQAMAALGHDRFALAGHDRGGRVGYRLALDFPEALSALAVLDIVPTAEVWARADDRFARAYWHWAFLALPAPRPEQMVLAAPHETFFAHHLQMVGGGAPGYPPEITDDYLDRVENPMLVRAMCEDYRAGATIDREHDEADRAAGRRIACPLLVLWGAHGALPSLYDDVLAIWREWAEDVRGEALDAGHYIPEDLPGQTAAALRGFFAA
jgi:haloacetate dehalogenase